MPTRQLDQFDEKAAFVLYFENEAEANRGLLDVHLAERLKEERVFPIDHLRHMAVHNGSHVRREDVEALEYDELFDRMIRDESLKLAVVIAGQGPEAYGMPEMFTPMQHINASRMLKRLTTLISDGRYSGVTFGAAVGHMTPEAYRDGGLLYLQNGDLLHLRFRKKRIELLDPTRFAAGSLELYQGDLRDERRALGQQRKERMKARQRRVAASNRLVNCTDASRGVVPVQVAQDAVLEWEPSIPLSEAAGEKGRVSR